MTELGELSLWLALLMSAWSMMLSAAGIALARDDFRLSGSRGLRIAASFTLLSAVSLLWALYSGDLSLRLVAMYTGDGLATPFRLSALWASIDGWLLLWNVAFAASAVVAVRARAADGGGPPPLAGAICAAVLTVTLAISALAVNPFVRVYAIPPDGRGLDPQLQDWARVLDAPLFAIGCSAVAIWTVLWLASLARVEGRVRRDAAAGAWPVIAIGGLAAGTAARVSWGYSHRGVLPSPAAPFDSASGSAFAVLLILAVLLVALSGARWSPVTRVLSGAGALLLLIGLVAEARGGQFTATLRDGETYQATDPWGVAWSFTSQGASRIERPGYLLTSVAFLPKRAAVRQPFIAGEVREYAADTARPSPPDLRAGIQRSFAQDVSIAIAAVGAGKATVRIRFAPLVSLVWIGGALFVAGTLVAAYSRTARRTVPS